MKITNPVLNALYKRVCEQLEKKNKTESDIRTDLSKKKKSKQYKGNILNPDMASTIEERVKMKFQLMNK